MNSVDDVLLSLKDELDNLPLIQEYKSLKEVVESDEELKRMRQEIARLTNEEKYEERDALLVIYNAHPIINNFNQIKEEVKELLRQIKDIISD